MKLKKWFIIGGMAAVILALLIYNVFYINIKTITAVTKTYTSEKISDDLDGLTVIFFSDLHYGTAVKEAEVKKLTTIINSFDPDIVLFGGDLIDDSDAYVFAQNEKDELVASLKDIDARYGKYAVLGNHDLGSSSIHETAVSILNSGDFEILTNSNTRIRIGNDFVNIVGIDSLILGEPDIEKAYSDIDDGQFTISLCHTPDVFDDISKTDIMFAGHSHGGQVYLPLLETLYRPNGAKKYFKGEYRKDDMLLDITNGVGTTLYDARFLADSEIIVYRLTSAS